MNTEEYVTAWKQIVDYYLEQTAETETVVTREETREETRQAGSVRKLSDALIRQVVGLKLEHPDQTVAWIGAQCDTYVDPRRVSEILRAGKYAVQTGKLSAAVESLRKRMIELGLMSKNPVW